MARGNLTPKQSAFVAEYLVDPNATQAAIRAGYSEKTAYSIGQRLLKNVEVQKAIAAAQAQRAQRVEITADRVVSELAKIAFADPRDLMKWGPNGVRLKDSAGLTEDQAASVAEVSETITKDGGSLRIKKYDRLKALELIGRHIGMFKDKVDLNILPDSLGNASCEQKALEARERLLVLRAERRSSDDPEVWGNA